MLTQYKEMKSVCSEIIRKDKQDQQYAHDLFKGNKGKYVEL